jgi:hypothetical protein
LGERRSLLLTSRELLREVIDPMTDAQKIEQHIELEPAHVPTASREAQVFSHGQVGQEVVRRPLIDVADDVSPEAAANSRRSSAHVAAFDDE